MFASLSSHWHDFASRKPGTRFSDIHRQRAQKQKGERPMRKILMIALAAALIAAGLFLLAVPGPGTVVLALGLAVFAGESLAVARFLDWLELKIRAGLKRWLSYWHRLGTGARVAWLAAAVIAAGSAAAGAVYLLFFA